MASPNNFVDLAQSLLIVQIMNLGCIPVAEVFLSVHVACVSSHNFDNLFNC
jgi:hypothetical protein